MYPGKRTGYASLPLHGGRAPAWLFSRMVLLSTEILTHIVEEFGAHEVLRRMSDPFWFQAFGCVLGFDWHSSGVTTTVCGAVKESLREAGPEWGLFAAEGKGATSRKCPAQILDVCERLGRKPDALVNASRIAAQVDNTAVQGGYQLYHHMFFFTTSGDWAVVQQGMNRSHVDRTTLPLVVRTRDELCRGTARRGLLRPPRRDAESRRMRELDVDSRYLSKILIKTYERAPEDKDGIPFPVDRPTYDRTIAILRRAVDRARVDRSERVRALKRLAEFHGP